MGKVRIQHRYAPLPPASLRSPKLTSRKVEAEGRCRMCQRLWSVRPPTEHHVVPMEWWIRQPWPLRSYRNAWAGIIGLCWDDHARVHSRDSENRLQARRMLRRSMTQAEIAFAIQVRGKEWFDVEYPIYDP